jgi:5-methylcytosine-specific restriction endonuclease McrA
MKTIFSKRQQYEKLIGTAIHYLKIKQLITIDKRMRFEAECICGKIFYPRCESVMTQTGCNPTKSCGCKRYDIISENSRVDGCLAKEIMKNYRYAAKKRKLSFDLTFFQFQSFMSSNCFYCGSPPTSHRVKNNIPGKRREQYLVYNGIDRSDNTIGYELNNCVACCSICNIAKSDLSNDMFLHWIDRIAKHNGYIKAD